MNEVDKAMDSVEQHDLYGQREVPIAHARVLAAEVRRLRAERDELRAMLEPTPDARELVNHLFGIDPEMYTRYSPMYIKVLQQQNEAAQLIAAHDARIQDEAAERAVQFVDKRFAPVLGRAWIESRFDFRAAVRGEV